MLLVVADVITPVNDDRNFVRAWVDWNNDRQFDDSERLMNRAITISDQPVQVSQSFTVPSDVTGIRRLRVKVNYDEGPLNDLGACQGFESGEVEDYQLEVFDPTSSRGQPRLQSGQLPDASAVALRTEADDACVGISLGEVVVALPPPSREQTLTPGGDRLFLNLRAMFPSDGDDPTAYSATSDNEALALVEILDGRLRVTSDQAGGVGVANIVVTASFADGPQAMFSFVLTVREETRSFLQGWRLGLLEDAQGSSQ